MKKNLRKRKYISVLTIATILIITTIAFAHTAVPYFLDWSNPNLITTDNVWSVSNDLRVRGYSGADTPVTTGQDARTVLAESFALNVRANQTNPNTLVPGGVAEFEIANPTIALKGSDTAYAPYVNVLVNTIGQSNIRFRATIRDLDSTSNNAVQQVAVQFRFRDDETGPFTDVPSAYIADATDPGTATRTSQIDVILPPEAENVIALEIRVLTVNAVGNDEWIGVDNIDVQSVPTIFPTTCNPSLTLTQDPTLFPDPNFNSFAITGAEGEITVDSINSGTGLRNFTVMSSTNATVNIPAFTPGTYAPVTATFSVINPNLPFEIRLRATNQFHGVLIQAQCACTPVTTIRDDPSMFPGGLSSFDVDTDEVGEITFDHIDSGTGLRTLSVVNTTNAIVDLPAFTPGTYDAVQVTYTIINPSLPVDITVRATSQFHGLIVRLACGSPPAVQSKNQRK